MSAGYQLEQQLKTSGARRSQGVWFFGNTAATPFEKDYIALRKKEGRFYSDEEVAQLPRLSPNHPLADEWAMRTVSLQRFRKYLQSREQLPRVLDLGCGNGWMSSALAPFCDCIAAMDMNYEELKQAARVFRQESGLQWIYGDVAQGILPAVWFDIILLASSAQYFASLSQLLHRLKGLLRPGGQIHILDTPFYTPEEAAAAQQRSHAYFAAQGFKNLAANYFHHTWQSLDSRDWSLLYDPRRLPGRVKNRLTGKKDSPFPWICISNGQEQAG